jgi:hypothetical protein
MEGVQAQFFRAPIPLSPSLHQVFTILWQ